LEEENDMLDEGFIRQWSSKFMQIATKGQGGGDYKDELTLAVEDLSKQVSAAFAGKERDYLQAVAGRLNVEATACEIYDPKVPNKLTDPQLNMLGRVAVLREAIEMVKALPAKS
jgi:hypothetical protein